jgi:single-strand DNA-binding protein
MSDFNKVILIGRLVRDPETRYTGSGKAVCNFAIAINNRSGGNRDDTTFIDIEAWERTAEFIQQWFHKGKLILLEGRLRQDKWEDKNTGQARSKLVVVGDRASFVGGKDDDQGGGGSGGGGGNYGQSSGGQGGGGQSRRQQPPADEPQHGNDQPVGDDGNVDDDLPF